MAKKTESKVVKAPFIERLAAGATVAAGSTTSVVIAIVAVIGWTISGPFFGFSANWQMVINTITSIITFLMVFLIQKSQNKDSLAIQLKLNELVAAHEYASNRLVAVESMTEEELKVIQKYYSKLSELAKQEQTLQKSFSIEKAELQNELKQELESRLEGEV